MMMLEEIHRDILTDLPLPCRVNYTCTLGSPRPTAKAGVIKSEVDYEQFRIQQFGVPVPRINDAFHLPLAEGANFASYRVGEFRISSQLPDM